MKIKMYISLNFVEESDCGVRGSIRNLINVTPVVAAWYRGKAALRVVGGRLAEVGGAVMVAALVVNRLAWAVV